MLSKETDPTKRFCFNECYLRKTTVSASSSAKDAATAYCINHQKINKKAKKKKKIR